MSVRKNEQRNLGVTERKAMFQLSSCLLAWTHTLSFGCYWSMALLMMLCFSSSTNFHIPYVQ